jgi:hypothetical protein
MEHPIDASSRRTLKGMASVRWLPSGRWELRVSIGRDPLTGEYRYKSKVVDAQS